MPNATIQLGYLAQTVNTTTKQYLLTAVFYNIDFRKKNDLFFVTRIYNSNLEHLKNNNKWVLIFEQDGILWMDMQKKLESNGYVVHLSKALPNKNFIDYVPFRSTVLRALSCQKKNMPNLVIADTDTAHTKELEKLKKQCKKKKLPIIYITSEIDDKITNKREKNTIGIFKKPFNTDTIIELIIEYFKNKII